MSSRFQFSPSSRSPVAPRRVCLAYLDTSRLFVFACPAHWLWCTSSFVCLHAIPMKPHPIPQRSTLVSQTTALLERGIGDGRWAAQLPSQSELCRHFAISRTTLRLALQALQRRGQIRVSQGCPAIILRRSQAGLTPPRISRVVLMLPEPLWCLRPSVARWAGELRPLVERLGMEFVLSENSQPYRARPEAHLEKLVQSHPASAWVVFGSTRTMQAWFANQGGPTILVGAAFPGIDLPAIAYDHAAIAQHAAAKLAAAGHERTAILIQRTGSAADATTCEAFAANRKTGAPVPVMLEHDGSLLQIESRLRQFARMAQRPTALFVTKSHAIPAVLTVLPQLGIKIPRDLSVICREDDPFLGYLVPTVARYSSDASAIARRLAVMLARLARGQSLNITYERLMPKFVVGRSIAPAPSPHRTKALDATSGQS